MSLSKKRKTEHIGEGEIYPDSLLSDVDTEIALEISLRKRLLDTLESRIAWATALKEILQQQVSGNSTPEAVRHVALDTLRVIEGPSNILLCHDPAPPSPPNPTQPTRLPSRRFIPSNNASTKPKPSFLFIRSSTLDLPFEHKDDGHRETTLYLLKCPACSKTSFTSLQGLLNHARLVHNFEWGTHEECITACAIPDNDLDVTCGTEVGVGPTGILPGLRNIFQMAVCGRNTRAERSAISENARDDMSSTKAPPSTLTNSLNQSLGLHDESPALAPFLGKGPIRRQIRVIDEDVEVNIEGVNQHMPSSRWRMPFSHRHSDFSSLPAFKAQNTEKKSDVESSNVEDFSLTSKTTISADSRFHLVSRIIITDRSQWIPPEEKILQHQKYTHKWMISVDSPSYAYHITSILNSVQVTADAGAHIPVPAPKTNPPFVVLGLADNSFLAKITLSFSGPYAQTGLSLSEQTFIFEHWVDLYPIKESHIVKGQDQVVDIELDKETIIRTPRRDYTPIDSRSLWNRPFDVTPVSVSSKKDKPDYSAEKYGERLAEIAKRFPMTIEDFQGKRSKLPKVPYMLADSSKHFLSFVTGRRKAIEWGRARAIHEAYTQSLGQSSYPKLPDLTVADVYSWLSEMGSFPRPTSSKPQPSTETFKDTHPSENSEPIWCRFCGLDIKVHASNSYLSKKEDTEDRLPPTEDTGSKAKLEVSECSIVAPSLQIAKLPRIDVKQFVLPDLPVTHVLKTAFDAKSLLAAADPSMVQCIHRLTKQWKLSTFHTMTSEQPHLVEGRSPTTMPLCQFGRNYHEVETFLAPHALLSLLTKQFVCTLISHGLDASNRDKARALFSIHSRKGKATRSQEIGSMRIITPTHLLSGILTRGLAATGKESRKHPMDAYLLLGMSKLGVAVDDDQSRDVRRNVFKVEDVT